MKATTFIYSSITFLCFFVACNNASKTSTGEENSKDTALKDTVSTAVSPANGSQNRDSISLQLVDGEATEQAMMEKGKHIVFSFSTEKSGKLTASVKPDQVNGNVRIAQIFLPNNVADGPFGPDMEYNLKEPGTYRIVVSENQMAGDPYNGPFTLTLKVTPR